VEDTFALAELLAADSHDLVHKAVGGWLREAGKHDPARLRAFLDAYGPGMPPTAMRYAVEHFDPSTRRHYRALATSADATIH